MDIQNIRDLVAKIEAGLINKSQNGQYNNYSDDRELLLSVIEVRSHIPRFILDSPNSDIALSYMKAHASGSGSWSLRRQFVRDNFVELRKYLDDTESNAALLTEINIKAEGLLSLVSRVAKGILKLETLFGVRSFQAFPTKLNL